MKHKHAELIKSWADGAKIQCLSQYFNEWIDVNSNPSWRNDRDYRIKPEPKPDEVRYLTCNFYYESFKSTKAQYPCDSLKLTFDGETGKLKKAEVL